MMPASPVRQGPAPAPGGTARADRAARTPEAARLRRSTREFEAIFLEQMLKTARQSLPGRPLGPAGAGHDVYRDMADEQFARSLSQAGGVGLSDLLFRNLLRADQRKASSPGAVSSIVPGESGRIGRNKP
jgi:flagellar protein FlgJ